MRIFLSGVSCAGKTTIGQELAAQLDIHFFDLDEEIESYFGTSIERLQKRFLTIYSYRLEASKALEDVLSRENSRNCIIALPPSGLMAGYWQVVKKAGGVIFVITDKPENILKRITFYDIDSKPKHMVLSEKEKELYLREIKKDITYFGRSYGRAHFKVDISGLNPKDAVCKLLERLRNLEDSGRFAELRG